MNGLASTFRFYKEKGPDYHPPDDAEGDAALAGDKPFIMHPDGFGWIWVPSGLNDGPLLHTTNHSNPRLSINFTQHARLIRPPTVKRALIILTRIHRTGASPMS